MYTNASMLPFLRMFGKSKKQAHKQGILEMFWKVQVNSSILNAIKQVPRYVMFLKELYTNKHKLKGNEVPKRY